MNLKKLGYASEYELVKYAGINSTDHEILRQYMTKLAAKLVAKYAIRYRVNPESLIPLAMAEFDAAFQQYLLRHGDQPRYKFSTYFVWWIKKAIERAEK
jgi:hypothetical protein